MLRTNFKYVINPDIDKVSDVDVLQELLGKNVKRKDIAEWQKKMQLFSYAKNPSQKEISDFLDHRILVSEEVLGAGLVVRTYENDIGIEYLLQDRICELSLNGFFNFCYRVQKELGLLKNIRCLLRADPDKCDKVIFPVVDELIVIFSAIGRAVGLPSDQRIGSDEAYPSKMGVMKFTIDKNNARGMGLASCTLAYHMFNVLPIDEFKSVYVNRTTMHGSFIWNMRIYTECSHTVENEEVEYVDELTDVEVPEEVELDLAIEEKDPSAESKKFGQLKLLTSAFAFLHELKDNKIDFENLYLIGCGTGHNNKVIMKYLGKEKKYTLMDPVVVASTYDDMITEGYNIEVKSKMVSLAQDFLPESVIISDIRSELDDESVLRDNYYQWSWSRRVRAISMKFKIPLIADLDRVYNIPVGTIFLQPYRGRTSRETRIFHYYGGMVTHMTARSYHRKNVFFNRYIRNKGYECFDCSYVKSIYSNVQVPYYAQMLIPRIFNVVYGEDGGYEKYVSKKKKKLKQQFGFMILQFTQENLFLRK